MTPEQNALVERLRELLTGEAVLREVSMFGGRAFMVNEKMVVSAGKDGSLSFVFPQTSMSNSWVVRVQPRLKWVQVAIWGQDGLTSVPWLSRMTRL